MKKIVFIATIWITLAFVGALFLPPSQVQAGAPSDSYTIERYYSEAVNEQTTTLTSFQDAATLTFTPPATKTFLVTASAALANSSTGSIMEAQFVINGTTYDISQYQPGGDATTNYLSFSGAKVISLSGATLQTIKIQFRVTDALGTAKIKNARIVAVEVTNYQTQEDETETSTTTSSTYVTAVTLTFTPPRRRTISSCSPPT